MPGSKPESQPAQAHAGVPLLLDEMHAPVVAATLRERGYDVLAVVDDPELRAFSDDEVLRFATSAGRRLVTENVKDFRRLLLRADEAGQQIPGLLFTSIRTFPRSRRNPGPLIDALEAWLQAPDVATRPVEDWLHPA